MNRRVRKEKMKVIIRTFRLRDLKNLSFRLKIELKFLCIQRTFLSINSNL